MEQLDIMEFGLRGLSYDKAPWMEGPEFLSQAVNVRIEDQWIKSIGAPADFTTFPYTGTPTWLMPVETLSTYFWVVASDTQIGAFDGTTWFDITPTVFTSVDVDARWGGFVSGTVPVVNNPQSFPMYWAPVTGATKLQYLPYDPSTSWLDADRKCQRMVAHKGFMIALGVTSGANIFPDLVQWSDVAEPGTIPTTWIPAADNSAGSQDIPDDGGRIVDAIVLNDDVLIFKENSIWRMTFIGGVFVWSFTKITTTLGLIAPQSAVEVKGKIYFIADGDLVVTDGFQTRSFAEGRVRRLVSGNVSSTQFKNSFAVRHFDRKEVWFCFVSAEASTYPDVAVVWNWTDDTFTLIELDQYGMISFGIQPEPGAVENWDSGQVYPTRPPDGLPSPINPPEDPSWNFWSGNWGGRAFNPLNDILVAVQPNSARLQIVDASEDSGDLDAVVTVQKLGIPVLGNKDSFFVASIYPNFTSAGNAVVQMRVGTQVTAGGSVTWKPFTDFTINESVKYDCRATGVFLCIEIKSEKQPYWGVSGLSVQYTFAGER